jgi:hypothetical protein
MKDFWCNYKLLRAAATSAAILSFKNEPFDRWMRKKLELLGWN